MYSPRNEEELKELSERLNDYIRRARIIRTGGYHLDTNTFFKSVNAMENEVKNLKKSYETEIKRLRQEISETASEKNQCLHQSELLESDTKHLQKRYECEKARSNRLTKDVQVLTQALDKKTKELLAAQCKQPPAQTREENSQNNKLQEALRQNTNLKDGLSAESSRKQSLEEQAKQLHHQLEFNQELARQQQAKLQNQLGSSTKAILNLEGQNSHLIQTGKEENIENALAAIKETANQELSNYKREAERRQTQYMTELRVQMDSYRQQFNSAADQNKILHSTVEQLNTQIRSLQGELLCLQQGKCASEENLTLERDRAKRHMQSLEAQLNDLQETLYSKMRELSIVKCANLPLSAEANGLKALISEEGERMNMAVSLQQSPSSIGYTPPFSRPTTTDGHTCSPRQTYLPLNEAGLVEPCDVTLTYTQPRPFTEGQSKEIYSCGRLKPHKKQRCFSAPVKMNKKTVELGHYTRTATLPNDLGKGKNYFDEMFKDENGNLKSARGTPVRVEVHNVYTKAEDYSHKHSSTICDFRILELEPHGKYIKILNTSHRVDAEFGGFIIQQNVAGVPAAFFRFPPRLLFMARSILTVYAKGTPAAEANPPNGVFVWKDGDRWGTGPECTTVLCKPNGQALAWWAAHHRAKKSLGDSGDDTSGHQKAITIQRPQSVKLGSETQSCSSQQSFHQPSERPLYLSRLDSHLPTEMT